MTSRSVEQLSTSHVADVFGSGVGIDVVHDRASGDDSRELVLETRNGGGGLVRYAPQIIMVSLGVLVGCLLYKHFSGEVKRLDETSAQLLEQASVQTRELSEMRRLLQMNIQGRGGAAPLPPALSIPVSVPSASGERQSAHCPRVPPVRHLPHVRQTVNVERKTPPGFDTQMMNMIGGIMQNIMPGIGGARVEEDVQPYSEYETDDEDEDNENENETEDEDEDGSGKEEEKEDSGLLRVSI